MPVNPLIKQFSLDTDDLESQLTTSLGGVALEDIGDLYNESVQDFEVDQVRDGKLLKYDVRYLDSSGVESSLLFEYSGNVIRFRGNREMAWCRVKD